MVFLVYWVLGVIYVSFWACKGAYTPDLDESARWVFLGQILDCLCWPIGLLLDLLQVVRSR